MNCIKGNLCLCVIGPQNSYFSSRQQLLLRELFMHMKITLNRDRIVAGKKTKKQNTTTQTHKSPTQTLQCSQRGGTCGEKFG